MSRADTGRVLRLFVASSNAGKLRDFAHAVSTEADIADRGIDLLPLPGLAEIQAPPEDEPSFAGNANAKALYYGKEAATRSPELRGGLVLADDSGLEVDTLQGAPGVRSARYADDLGFELGSTAGTDARNNNALLRQLEIAFSGIRTARYRCVLAVAPIDVVTEVLATAEGTLEGEILQAPRGAAGFGYDPLFLLTELGLTMAEVGVEQRLRLSHRGRALRNLIDKLVGLKRAP